MPDGHQQDPRPSFSSPCEPEFKATAEPAASAGAGLQAGDRDLPGVEIRPTLKSTETTSFKTMPDGHQQHPRPTLHPDPVSVTLNIDADVLDWLQEQPLWQREINDLLRFIMEAHLIREAAAAGYQ